MSTLNTQLPSLVDHLRRMDPNGAIANIVESVSRQSPLIADAQWMEGNLPTGHKFSSRTALPSLAYRRLNEGVAPSKSRVDQVTETCAQIAGFSVVDVDEANLNGNQAAFRASEDTSFVAAMTIEAERAMIYSSTATNPEAFHGLLPRFDATTGPGGKQIILHGAGGSNVNTSMLLVGWGKDSVFGIYPKGSKGGIDHNDRGIQVWDDGTGKKFDAYVSGYKWNLGLCVKDQRFVSAVRNIDTTTLSATGNAIIVSAVKAYNAIYAPNAVNLSWYVNRTIATFLHLQALDGAKNGTLTIETIAGKPVTHLLGIPVRVTDAILNTEAAIS